MVRACTAFQRRMKGVALNEGIKTGNTLRGWGDNELVGKVKTNECELLATFYDTSS